MRLDWGARFLGVFIGVMALMGATNVTAQDNPPPATKPADTNPASPQTAAPSPSAATPAAAAATASSGYHFIKKIKLGGEGGWDYIAFDSPTHRLFISREKKVIVLDVDTEKVVGEISNTAGVHGIALAPELNRGFVSDGRTNDVTIFDLKTLATISEVGVGDGPDAIVYDPASMKVYTLNGRGKTATSIDAAAGKVIATIPLAGKPEFAVADGQGHVFANIEDKNQLVQIDTRKDIIAATWPLAPCESPSGLAMDLDHRRLFVGCDNAIMAIVNADNGQILATPAIGEGVDANSYDPGTFCAFASNGGSGTLSIVHEDSPVAFTKLEDIPTQKGARTMTIDPRTHQVFLVTADFGPPPEPTTENPHPRRTILPDTFVVLVYAR
jgi:DNA-binding beta-propeller fold protein YncE